MLPLNAALLWAGAAMAQTALAPAQSFPPIPTATDAPYPGTIDVEIDASDTTRGIFRVRETIPVARPGAMVLLYPEWIPGHHAPSGSVENLAGLVLTADGKPLPWRRDTIDLHAFHVDVPDGVRSIRAEFQFLSAATAAQGPVVMTDDMLNLEWISMALYPAGHAVRGIRVQPSVTLPAGWTMATALRGTTTGTTTRFEAVSFETLMDSPLFAGRTSRRVELKPGVALTIFADRPQQLAATDAQIALHRNLVDQADRLFGARHFDHYDFLFALSDELTRIGLEHHRSSQNAVGPGYFTAWAQAVRDRSLLPHEYVHSWNGKHRRPADLSTPDYRTPMQDSLLWVYEGQTQFWGSVLAARSGLVSPDEALGELASVAATFSEGRPGRQWRNLQDTTNQPVIGRGATLAWTSWQRSADYYPEGQLLWLDADMLIRERTGGKRSLDDFARSFFGGNNGDWSVRTYRFADVVEALNRVAPLDWAGFLRERLDATGKPPPLDWLARGGYRLEFTDKPNIYDENVARSRKVDDFTYSVGLLIGTDAKIQAVRWNGPAFAAGIVAGDMILAVDQRAYSADLLRDAITAAKGSGQPINVLVKSGDRYREHRLQWTGGLRYPRLVRIGKDAALDALLKPLPG
jgi:predicted metalloprotease with PDZ domain